MSAHKLPRYADARGRLFRRGPFLDGTLKTYFAPGQTPFSALNTYGPPTDWPVAGSLLRTPRTVWVSLNFGSLLTDAVTHGVGLTVVPAHAIFEIIFASTPFPNGFASRYLEIRSAAYAFLADISSRSGGKVSTLLLDSTLCSIPGQPSDFVRANYFGNEIVDPSTGVRLWDGFTDAATESGSGRFLMGEMVGPPDDSSFFGTDFLNIHIGQPSYWVDNASADPGSFRDYETEIAFPITPTMQAIINAEAIIRVAYSKLSEVLAPPGKFSGYSCRLFGQEGYKIDRTYLDAVDHPIGLESNFSIETVHDGRVFPPAPLNAMVEAESLILADVGFEYLGTSELVTFDSLSRIVASTWPDLAAEA